LIGYSQVFLQQQQQALHLSRHATDYTPQNKPNDSCLLDWLLTGVSPAAAAASTPSVETCNRLHTTKQTKQLLLTWLVTARRFCCSSKSKHSVCRDKQQVTHHKTKQTTVAYLIGYSQVSLLQQEQALRLSRQATGHTPQNKPNNCCLLDWLLPGVSAATTKASTPSVETSNRLHASQQNKQQLLT
jgi:hypothetical protein